MKPGHLLDLGCGHGMFSILAKEMGWRVTAVDARPFRMPMVRGIRWVKRDVRDFEVESGKYDCIAILGLLYHLELKDQLDLLRRCASHVTIVDTHVSLEPDIEELGYRGELFDEAQGRTEEEHAGGLLSSWKNPTSFWADEGSLIRMFKDCGYAEVYRLTPSYESNRTFYLLLPPSDVDAPVERTLETIRRHKAAAGDATSKRSFMNRVVRKLRLRG